MNGRVYDPEIGRFLSADPLIQAPFNPQSLNRYAYVLNNPLSLTDPTGFYAVGNSWGDMAAAGETADPYENTRAFGTANDDGSPDFGGVTVSESPSAQTSALASGSSAMFGPAPASKPLETNCSGSLCNDLAERNSHPEKRSTAATTEKVNHGAGAAGWLSDAAEAAGNFLANFNPIGSANAQTAVPVPGAPPIFGAPQLQPGTPENDQLTDPLRQAIENAVDEVQWLPGPLAIRIYMEVTRRALGADGRSSFTQASFLKSMLTRYTMAESRG